MRLLISIICFSAICSSCTKTTETLDLTKVEDLYPIAVGKTFFYRLDSTLTSSFGSSLITKSYHAKDSVESSFTDGSGRPSFRIYRYLRDTLNTQPWAFAATYVATIYNKKLEFVDNNLRFVSIAEPITENNTWKGNVYINTVLPSPYYFLDNWDYAYQDLKGTFKVKKGTIADTYTVLQQNTQTPATFNAAVYNEKSYSVEVYAKGIGLIYKEFLHYIWQPTPSPARFQDDSYGVKLNLMDYK